MVHRAAHDEQAGSACPAKALRWDCGGLVAIHCVSLAAMTFLRQHKVAPSSRLVSHLTVRALSMVSAVVKVLETTTAMVVAGSRLLSARATSTGSTLARNRSVRPRASSAAACRKASRVQVQQRYLAGVSDGSCLIAQCSASAASPSADDTSVLPSDTTGHRSTRRLGPAPETVRVTWSVRSAVCTKSGPRKEPPIPMATTLVIRWPVAPRHSPLRTRSLNSLIWSSTSHTSGTTFLPSAMMVCSGGRPSDLFAGRGVQEHVA